MLPLGGAFAKYVDTMWDDNGASSPWEFTGIDPTLDGIPEWWQDYAWQNYDAAGKYDDYAQILWDSIVVRDGVEMTAREAYWRDLAAGMMVENGVPVIKPGFEQVADVNGNGVADWWENMFGISMSKAVVDSDNDGLADFAEYLVAETFKFANVDPTMPRTDGKRLDEGGVWEIYYRTSTYVEYVLLGKATGIDGETSKFNLQIDNEEYAQSFSAYRYAAESEIEYEYDNFLRDCLCVKYNTFKGTIAERSKQTDFTIDFEVVEPLVIYASLEQGKIDILYKDLVENTSRSLSVVIANRSVTFATSKVE